ncbi:MAG: zinc-ribbon domain-containing protein [Candidatus Saliniplasma sp.]
MAIEPIWILIIAIIWLVGISVGILFYLEKTKDKRVSRVREASSLDPEDEAYNKVKSTKSIVNVMKRSGKNTSDSEVIIDRAELALEARDYSRAKSLAEKAKSKLENNTNSGANTDNKKILRKKDASSDISDDSKDSKMKEAYTLDDIDSLGTEEESEKVRAKSEELQKQKEKIQNLPVNYLESKFEIEQASEMLENEGGDAEAEDLLKKARVSFDEERYTEALSLSLRCKKAIDEDKAGVIKFQKIGKKEASKEKTGTQERDEVQRNTVIKQMEEGEEDRDSTTTTMTADVEKERTESPKTGPSQGEPKCPSCGYVGDVGDNFCPKCGTEMEILLTCPSCGNEVGEDDNFCPKCGHELTPSAYECPECGTEISEDVRFCPGCGIEFE